jgi:hypothetical protein
MDEIIIVPNVRSLSQSMKESKSYFFMPCKLCYNRTSPCW